MLERIKQLAGEKNISIRALEVALGFGNGTIGKWDESSPTIDKLKKVADYLGVTVTELLKGSE